MKIEAGKYYEDADGKKRGPMERCGALLISAAMDDYDVWDDYGKILVGLHSLIREWQSGPVREVTVTRKEIVAGVHGKVSVHEWMEDSGVRLALIGHRSDKDRTIHCLMNASELRAAAATLLEIAEALE